MLAAVSAFLLVAMPLDAVAASHAPVAPGMEGAGAEGADSAADPRLVLQLGMLFALLYIAFACVWLSRARRGRSLGHAVQRMRSLWSAIRPGRARATADPPWTCAIAWKAGRLRSRFQAVISAPDDRKRRVVAESAGLPWPPRDVRNPPAHELEAALGALVAAILAAGWEPVESMGSWSERQFVWRRPGEPPATLRPSRSRPPPRPAETWRTEPAGPRSAMPAGWSSTPSAGAGDRRARRG